jgi:hypothetical protein
MTRLRILRPMCLAGAFGILGACPLDAQKAGFDVGYGFWRAGQVTRSVFTASYYRPLVGPIGYSVGFTHLDDRRSPDDRTLSGAELGLSIARDGSGPYVVGSAGLGVLHRGGGLDAVWTVGAGYAIRPFAGVSLGIEARYRLEDTGVGGFWRLFPADRRGLAVHGRLAIGIGRGRGDRLPPSDGPPAPPSDPPSPESIHDLAREGGASDEAARVTTSVVETALSVMGTPYAWGGTDENGFDCSGLIQHAYAEHGVILPRISRDQMRMGSVVDRRQEALRPGDLLGFSVEGNSSITHIGLYVGEGQFIHSGSSGVRLSSLTAGDGDSRWWQQRWVSARRIVE